MNGFPGVCIRIQARLKALGYSKNGRPDILRFCQERAYRPQYLYAWLRGRLPAWENLVRLARDLDVSPEGVMVGTGGGAGAGRGRAGPAGAPGPVAGKRRAAPSPPEPAPTLESAARDALAASAPASVEFTLPSRAGDGREPVVRSYEARFVPLAERAPAPPRLLMIVRDITERKRAEDPTRAPVRAAAAPA